MQTTSARKADRHLKPNKNDINDVGHDMGNFFTHAVETGPSLLIKG